MPSGPNASRHALLPTIATGSVALLLLGLVVPASADPPVCGALLNDTINTCWQCAGVAPVVNNCDAGTQKAPAGTSTVFVVVNGIGNAAYQGAVTATVSGPHGSFVLTCTFPLPTQSTACTQSSAGYFQAGDELHLTGQTDSVTEASIPGTPVTAPSSLQANAGPWLISAYFA